MTELDERIAFIRIVLSESDNPVNMKTLLRKELARLSDEFSRREDELLKEAA